MKTQDPENFETVRTLRPGALGAPPPRRASPPSLTLSKSRVLTFSLSLCLCASVVLRFLLARAVPQLITGAFITVNNTSSNSPSTQVGTFAYPRGEFIFGNLGLSSTNALTNTVQISIDTSNWVSIGTYQPSLTNATNEPWFLPQNSQPIYLRVVTSTTNSVQAAVLYQQ